jgi:lipoprotein-releasing system permease protein
VFVPLDLAADFLGYNNRVSGLEIYVTKPKHITSLRQQVGKTVGPDLRVFDWIERNRSFLNALKVERNVMFLILTLIILVAAFNIISSMIMLVRSKNSDIAVLRTMGASGGTIIRVFLMTGASIGIVGTFVGSAVGILFCWNIDTIKGAIERLSGAELFAAEIYFLSHLPAKIDLQEVLMVVVMALGLSFLASQFLLVNGRGNRFQPQTTLPRKAAQLHLLLCQCSSRTIFQQRFQQMYLQCQC